MTMDLDFVARTFSDAHRRSPVDACRVASVGLPRGVHRRRRDLDAGLRVKPLEFFARGYVAVFRGTPLLIQLFIVYYGLPPCRPCARACSGRSCAMRSIARRYRSRFAPPPIRARSFAARFWQCRMGRSSSARACGMSNLLLFRRIVFPIALRHALPAYSTEMISMVKATALVSLVTLWDVMSVALKIRNDTLVTYLPLLVAGAIYFVVNLVIGAAFLGWSGVFRCICVPAG